MINGKSFLCIIPARGGSKGLPGKNIHQLHNKPLIAYSIEAAKKAEVFDEIMINTDSKDIAEVAKRYGASVPFLRPKELASDTAHIMDTYMHTLDFYGKLGKAFDYLMVLLPTAPLRSDEDIKGAINLVIEKSGDSVLSVCEVDHPPLWMNTLDESLSIKNFISPEIRQKNRQELPNYYRINGAIYLSKVETLQKYRDWYSGDSYAYIMPKSRSVDIDSLDDLLFAEFLLQKNNKLS